MGLPAETDPGKSRLLCIAGLGNPGSRYQHTPHNAGWWVVDELSRRHTIPVTRNEHGCLTGSGRIGNDPVLLIKPQSFMNNSGPGIGAILRYRNLETRDLVVVYDELDLPWGALRIKESGSAAGHNGVKSIIGALKTDVFVRVRVGIRPSHELRNAADYVLAPLEPELATDEREIVAYTADAIETIVAEGAVQAMTKFNRRARGIQEEDA